MLTVAEALDIIGRCVEPLAPRRVRFNEALGLRLAGPVTSRVDSPPFDKSTVDGFALSSADRSATLRVIEMVTAGAVPTNHVTPGTAIRIMTGAPLPVGADAVAKVEDVDQVDDSTIRNPAATGDVEPTAGVLKCGAAFRVGEVVLEAGKRLGPLEIVLLAEIGQAEISAIPRPRVGVLPTGDELVAADQPCGPGQIRNSNGPMLMAAVASAGATPDDLGVARDELEDLREKIARGLECDVLLISGGVSAGVKDLVPGVLADLGVRQQFHQVRVKPGKPLWFGTSPRDGLVYGLPGNPVSTMATFKLFVEPALATLAGAPFAATPLHAGILAGPTKHRGARPTYHPSKRSADAGGGPTLIEPLEWQGSADLATLTGADCLALLPEGDYELAAGAAIRWIAL